MHIFLYIAAILGCIGLFHLLCSALDVPTAEATAAVMVKKRKQTSGGTVLIPLSSWIGRHITLDKYRRDRIQSALTMLELSISPETYVVKAFLISAAVLFCSLPVIIVFPIGGIGLAVIAVSLWFKNYYSVFDDCKRYRRAIERETPRLANSLCHNLEFSRDVMQALLSYRKVAGKQMGNELDRTIAEMRTGNYEQALLSLDSRIGSAMLSSVIRGLIGILRGDDQQMYFKMICFDLKQEEQEFVKREAQKRPEAIHRYAMLMLLCILIIYFVVLGVQMVSTMNIVFM